MTQSDTPRTTRFRLRDLVLGFVAAAAIAVALWQLALTTRGLDIRETSVGTTPVTVFRAADQKTPAPVVVIAHGFAGSQQLMQPFAVTLARNGYVAVTFDFLGHGRNPTPAGGDINHVSGTTVLLVKQLGEVLDFAKNLPGTSGQIALLGHSMASDIVVRTAQQHPEVFAAVTVSMFSPAVTADSPKNLLVVVGDWEPGLKREALRVLRLAAGPDAQPGVMYGSFDDGTARKIVFSPHVEHVAVLYGPAGLAAARDWLDAAFHHAGSGYVDDRGPWIALLLLGIVVLAKPLAGLLPRLSPTALGASLRWRTLLPVGLAPAVLTPLLLWKAPTDFLPMLVGDYLALHFALYGLLTGVGLWLAGRLGGRKTLGGQTRGDPPIGGRGVALLLLSAALVALYGIGAFGLALDTYVTSFVPVAPRLPILAALAAGTLPYFLADEWATRGAGATRGAYPATKLFFVLSLAAAIALNLEKLFFLILIVPVIVLFFVIYGLFSRFAYRSTHQPLVGAIANALAFAWAIAVTFPLIPR